MLFLELVGKRKDRHRYQRMNLMSMLGTFHPRRHKTQRYVHVFVSSLEFDLSWQMASSCLGTDFGCGRAVEDGSLLFVDQPHSQIQLGLMNMNDS